MGFQVFATVRSQSDGDRISRAASIRLEHVILDVTEIDSIAEALKRIEKATNGRGLDGLVNNAGLVVGGPLELLPIERLRMQLEVNLIGQIAVTQAFLPLIRRATGRIVNMSSISGRVAAPMIGAYAISKFAFEAFSDSLRRELSAWGIKVSVIEPGAISTPIWQKSISRADKVLQKMPERAKQLYGKRIEQARDNAVKMSNGAIPAIEVAKVVHRALTASRPRTRYVVGREAKIAARLAWLLPDKVMDWIIEKSRTRH
jgi:NAD(P)-dependent dehydrogenase (short-subunit alcohol dehydrogenase family)